MTPQLYNYKQCRTQNTIFRNFVPMQDHRYQNINYSKKRKEKDKIYIIYYEMHIGASLMTETAKKQAN